MRVASCFASILLAVCWGVSVTLVSRDVRAVTPCRGGLDMPVAHFLLM